MIAAQENKIIQD